MTTVGRWSPNKVRKRLLEDTWVFPNSGMILMRPTSIVVAGVGATASIGVNGSVTFTSAESLSLDGVFTSGYDNYMVVMRHLGSAANTLLFRLRASGTDASGSNYTRQFISADNTTVSGARATSQTSARVLNIATSQRQGDVVSIYGPYLAQPTAMRNVSAGSASNAEILDFANTHSLSTSYDGFTLITGTGTFTGLVSVYGLGG